MTESSSPGGGLDSIFTLNQRRVGIMQPRPASTLHVGGDLRLDGDIYCVGSDALGTLGVPTGSIQMFGSATAPVGWLLCDGSAVSRTTYAKLFGVLSTAWGVGDGSTTFNLPDLRGRVPVGVSGSHALGTSGGEEQHTLTAAEMPQHNHGITEAAHSHTITAGSHSHTITDPSHLHSIDPFNDSYQLRQTDNTGTQQYATAGSQAHTRTVYLGQSQFASTGISGTNTATTGISGTNTASTGLSTQNAGSTAAHNVMQPFLAVSYVIKA